MTWVCVEGQGENYNSVSPSSKEINENTTEQIKMEKKQFSLRNLRLSERKIFRLRSIQLEAERECFFFPNAGTSVPNSTASHPRR
jgi:hypothetical protein